MDPSIVKCGTYVCSNNAVQKANHEVFDWYFAMCGDDSNSNKPIVLDACPVFYAVNVTSQVCEPNCDKYKDKNIPDYEDCHFYYHCGTNYLTENIHYPYAARLECPKGQAYDPNTYNCEDETTVDSCNKKTE